MILARRRVYRYASRLTESCIGPLWDWERKSGGKALAIKAGVPSPITLAGPCHLRDIDFDSLPDRFVIKPDWGTNSRGVFVIERNGEIAYDHLSDTSYPWGQLPEIVSMHSRDGGFGIDQLLVEELATEPGTPPIDWKFYCFYGEVGLIMQIRRANRRKEYKFYDPYWTPLGRIRPSVDVNPALPLPVNSKALSAMAARLSRHVPTPFIRIDLYETKRAVTFGEFTIAPGGTQLFNAAIDYDLGIRWDEAAGRLALANTPIVIG